PTTTPAGVADAFTITAPDGFSNKIPGYSGTIHFTSSDAQASLPTDYSFVGGDNSVHTFNATFRTAGSQALTATDTTTASITGTHLGIAVNAATAVSLAATGFPSPTTAGLTSNVTVTAKDVFGNTVGGTPTPR